MSYFQMIIIIASFLLCQIVNYCFLRLNISRLNTYIPQEEYEQKKRELERRHKKYSKFIFILLVLFLIIRILLIVISVMNQSKVELAVYESISIVHTDSDIKKKLNEVFINDLTEYDDEPDDEPDDDHDDEEIEDEWRKKLHFEWMDDLTFKSYGRQIYQIYSIVPDKEDELSSKLAQEDSDKIKEYSAKLDKLQEIKKTRELTLDEAIQEYEYYMDIYDIRNSAEVIFQAGRAAEDVFWKYSNEKEIDYEKLLEYAACSISCFELFLRYENRQVHIEGKEINIQTEELCFRNGKLYYKLRDFATVETEKQHFDLCAYSCFGNITTDDELTNRLSIKGYYYLCLAIQNILLDFSLSGSEYENIVQEGEEAAKKGLKLYDEIDFDSEVLYEIESGIRSKLESFQNIFPGYSRYAQTPNAAGYSTA